MNVTESGNLQSCYSPYSTVDLQITVLHVVSMHVARVKAPAAIEGNARFCKGWNAPERSIDSER